MTNNGILFRCNRSGNTISFTSEVDIAELRKHQCYTEVKDEDANERKDADEKRQDAQQEEVLVKQRGRPKKK